MIKRCSYAIIILCCLVGGYYLTRHSTIRGMEDGGKEDVDVIVSALPEIPAVDVTLVTSDGTIVLPKELVHYFGTISNALIDLPEENDEDEKQESPRVPVPIFDSAFMNNLITLVKTMIAIKERQETIEAVNQALTKTEPKGLTWQTPSQGYAQFYKQYSTINSKSVTLLDKYIYAINFLNVPILAAPLGYIYSKLSQGQINVGDFYEIYQGLGRDIGQEFVDNVARQYYLDKKQELTIPDAPQTVLDSWKEFVFLPYSKQPEIIKLLKGKLDKTEAEKLKAGLSGDSREFIEKFEKLSEEDEQLFFAHLPLYRALNNFGVWIQELLDAGWKLSVDKLERSATGPKGPTGPTGPKGIYFSSLDLSNHHISSLNGLHNIANIDSLKILGLNNNQINTIPATLPDNLFGLHLNNNQISTIPDSLPASLRRLYLNNNQISIIPDSLPASLGNLNLDNNQISTIPATLPANLYELSLKENPLSPDTMVRIEKHEDLPPDLTVNI